jgi:hypothetical protein
MNHRRMGIRFTAGQTGNNKRSRKSEPRDHEIPSPCVLSPVAKTLVVILIFCTLACTQSAMPVQSPKEVVEAYRRMDANGERLRADGWKKGNAFFLNPGSPPRARVVGVMTGEVVGQAKVDGINAEVWTEFDFVGKVDPTGRFSRPGGSPTLKGPIASRRKYSLVLTAQHVYPDAKGQTTSGASEWKIKDFEPNSMVTVEVAIRYLERLRDKTSRDEIKRNAERSIKELNAFRNQ